MYETGAGRWKTDTGEMTLEYMLGPWLVLELLLFYSNKELNSQEQGRNTAMEEFAPSFTRQLLTVRPHTSLILCTRILVGK